MDILRALLFIVAFILLVATLLPLSTSNEWWIRVWDFPRAQVAAASLAVGVISIFVFSGPWLVLPGLMLLCGLYQTYIILPYTIFHKTEVELATPKAGQSPVTFLAANVLMENRDTSLLAGLIDRTDPDVLFLMETDQHWLDALYDQLQGYSTVVALPRDDHYGLIFATRLDRQKAEVVYLSDDDTPTLLAELQSPDGYPFHFVGLHPRPPVPGQDTDERDEQTRKSATFAQRASIPVISMGDFNDVAWSRSARAFKRAGDYVDPRVGRGFLASFNANHPIWRFPIDQLYFTDGVGLVSFGRGDYVASDHFPMIAKLIINPISKTKNRQALHRR